LILRFLLLPALCWLAAIVLVVVGGWKVVRQREEEVGVELVVAGMVVGAINLVASKYCWGEVST